MSELGTALGGRPGTPGVKIQTPGRCQGGKGGGKPPPLGWEILEDQKKEKKRKDLHADRRVGGLYLNNFVFSALVISDGYVLGIDGTYIYMFIYLYIYIYIYI